MLDGLDAIRWNQLTHAYGPAGDVPALLRALQTAAPNARSDDAPLYQLFGNIWHRGTVYEATAYAVPFLLELAAAPATPDRVGILQLLSDIAHGNSYHAVHGNRRGEADFETKLAREGEWAAAAHRAVDAGFDALVAMTRQPGDVRLAAANVLARLPNRGRTVAALLRDFYNVERIALRRAGVLLLLGQTADRSPDTVLLLTRCLEDDDDLVRYAAAASLARLRPSDLPAAAQEIVLEMLEADDVRDEFEGLPWDAASDIDPDQFRGTLDEAGAAEAADRLITAIESGGANHDRVSTLLDMLFPQNDDDTPPPPIRAKDLTSLQLRGIRALAHAITTAKHNFHCHFPQWGLPELRRDWRELAAGRDPVPVDQNLPILADSAAPRTPLHPDRLKPGQRVLHRAFGPGKVKRVDPGRRSTTLTVDFDDEGQRVFMLPSDGSLP